MIDTAALRKMYESTPKAALRLEYRKEWETFIWQGDNYVGNIVWSINRPLAMLLVEMYQKMPALLDELDRLRAHIAANDHYYDGGDTREDAVRCQGCHVAYLVGECDTAKHEPGCIVAEARAAQKEGGV